VGCGTDLTTFGKNSLAVFSEYNNKDLGYIKEDYPSPDKYISYFNKGSCLMVLAHAREKLQITTVTHKGSNAS
jgi:hypothetical protein